MLPAWPSLTSSEILKDKYALLITKGPSLSKRKLTCDYAVETLPFSLWSLTIVIHALPLVPCCVKYLVQLQFDAASDFLSIPLFNDLYSEIQKY